MHLEVLNEVVLSMEGKEKRVWIIKNELESSTKKFSILKNLLLLLLLGHSVGYFARLPKIILLLFATSS